MIEPTLFDFDKMPIEKMSDKVSRRFISGNNATLVFFDLKKGAIVPEHHHVNEQISYITKGKVKVTTPKKEFIVSKGEVLVITSNTPHRFEALEDTHCIDLFSPIRQDWIEGKDSYLRST